MLIDKKEIRLQQIETAVINLCIVVDALAYEVQMVLDESLLERGSATN